MMMMIIMAVVAVVVVAIIRSRPFARIGWIAIITWWLVPMGHDHHDQCQ